MLRLALGSYKIHCCLLVGFAFFTQGCSVYDGQAITKPTAQLQTRLISPQTSFDSLMVVGPVDLVLHTGYSKQKVSIRANADDLLRLAVHVDHHMLTVKWDEELKQYVHPEKPKGSIIVDVYLNTLRELVYRGQGRIIGHSIRTQALSLSVNNSGKMQLDGQLNVQRVKTEGDGIVEMNGVSGDNVQVKLKQHSRLRLTGMIGLSSLDVTGTGLLSAYWVKSPSMVVRAHQHAHVLLAGVTDRLDVKLWDNAHFNGQYLRAKRTYVNSHQASIAQLATTCDQHTLAEDESNIYFYKLPTARADFMGSNGAVLDMRAFEAEEVSEYTHYNK